MTAEERMEICKACPLYKEDKFYGAICDNEKYISPDGKEWSYFKKEGWIRGCSCKLSQRVRNSKNHCVAGRW